MTPRPVRPPEPQKSDPWPETPSSDAIANDRPRCAGPSSVGRKTRGDTAGLQTQYGDSRSGDNNLYPLISGNSALTPEVTGDDRGWQAMTGDDRGRQGTTSNRATPTGVPMPFSGRNADQTSGPLPVHGPGAIGWLGGAPGKSLAGPEQDAKEVRVGTHLPVIDRPRDSDRRQTRPLPPLLMHPVRSGSECGMPFDSAVVGGSSDQGFVEENVHGSGTFRFLHHCVLLLRASVALGARGGAVTSPRGPGEMAESAII